MLNRTTLFALPIVAIGLAGCATIIQGTTQQIGVSSQPSGAVVKVNNQPMGQTPIVLNLKRRDSHTVTIELDGYQPYNQALTRSLSGWVAGNIIFGGLIGLVVDAATGGMYKLSPEQIAPTLGMRQATLENVDDVLYIAVVLHADPSWEKIGQLERR
jgi:hypothetical protein